MSKKLSHGELVNQFDNSDDHTLENFIATFKTPRSQFKGISLSSFVEVGNIVYEKDEFTARHVYIGKTEYLVKFIKRKKTYSINAEQEREWLKSLQSIYSRKS